MIIYTVYDNKAKYYLNPFFAVSRGEALRQFIHACNSPDHQFYQYAEDFTLMEIGVWDPNMGEIKMHERYESSGRAWELKCSNRNAETLATRLENNIDSQQS